MNYIIETERLNLRQLTDDDFDNLKNILIDNHIDKKKNEQIRLAIKKAKGWK